MSRRSPFAQMALDPISFLHDLVAIPSLSRQEAEVAQFLCAFMRACGFDAAIDEAGNAVGIRSCPNSDGNCPREIALLGHMDTVPGQIPVRIENGILHGRGAVDAKGPLATFVMAASRAHVPMGTRVVVVGAVEEEVATSRGARHVAQQYRPTCCIVGEPSGWDGVTIGYKGRILFDLEISRPTGHTAGRQSGVAESAIDWWNRLSDFVLRYNADHSRLFDQLIPSIRSLQTNSDGLMDTATLKAGIRLPPGFDCEALIATANRWTESGTLKAHGHEEAYESSRTSSLARQFSRALRQAGVQARFKLKTGTCDMNVVGPIWKCPIVAYGPGDSTLDHTPQEHIVLEEYLRAIEILTNVLESM